MSLITNARTLIDQNRSGSLGPITVTKFPDDIEAVPHKMIITTRKRAYGAGGGTITAGQVTTSIGSNIIGTVVLPVPANIIENYSASYQNIDLGVIGNAIAGATSEVVNGQGNIVNRITGALSGLGADLTGVSQGESSPIGQGMLNLAGAAAYQGAINLTTAATSALGFNTPVRQAVAAGTGMIFNPHQTAIFSGVNIRVMHYNWTLAPKKEKESQAIERIVSILRKAMLPKRSTNGLFLEFPDEVEYKILGPAQEYSMPTTPCVITNLTLNRTGAGAPVFFAKTGAPVVYTLQIGLMEIRALLRDDFENTNRESVTPQSPTPTPPPYVEPQTVPGEIFSPNGTIL